MKKTTLIFTLLCVSALNGMEPEPGRYVSPLLQNLPNDVQSIIITYLHENLSLKETIDLIKKTSLINKELNTIVNDMYGNPKGFKALVYMLANKFNTDTLAIVNEFKTPAAKKYFELGFSLIQALTPCGNIDINQITKLLNEGADPNYILFTGDDNETTTPLLTALRCGGTKLIKLLLDNGANPHLKDWIGFTALNYAKDEQDNQYKPTIDRQAIITLLEEAIKKEQ